MDKKIIIAIVVILILIFANSSLNIFSISGNNYDSQTKFDKDYCEQNNGIFNPDDLTCLFNDGTKCNIYDFLDGYCGKGKT